PRAGSWGFLPLHALGRTQSQELETVAQDDLDGPGEDEPRGTERLVRDEDGELRVTTRIASVVPRVDHARGGLEELGDHVGRAGVRGALDDLREEAELLDDVLLGGLGEETQVDAVRGDAGRVDAGLAEDAGHAGVRVLDLVDRVLLGLVEGQVEVEEHLRVAAPHEEEVAGDVDAGLLEELPQRDELAGPLAEPDLPAAARDADDLDDLDLEELGEPEAGERGLHPRGVAVGVGAPVDDHALEAAARLVPVIGDVREEVGVGAVALDEDAVLVIPERRGTEPLGAFLLVGQAAVAEVAQRVLDLLLGIEAGLWEPGVE